MALTGLIVLQFDILVSLQKKGIYPVGTAQLVVLATHVPNTMRTPFFPLHSIKASSTSKLVPGALQSGINVYSNQYKLFLMKNCFYSMYKRRSVDQRQNLIHQNRKQN